MLQVTYSDYQEELVQRIQELVRIESIYDPAGATEAMPYGPKIQAALDYVEALAGSYDLKTWQLGGHVLVVETTNPLVDEASAQRLDIVSHIDVVQEGTGWTRAPFGGELEGGKLYGRGSLDMKRAAVVTVVALGIINQSGQPLGHRLRVVIGTDEETNMADLPVYVAAEGAPDFAITPDATFPLTLGEKGATTWQFDGALQEGSVVVAMDGGVSANVVPSSCGAVLAVDSGTSAQVEAYCRDRGWDYDLEAVEAGMTLTLYGQSAHASRPDLGVNAIVRMGQVLADIYEDPLGMWLGDYCGDYYGEGLGLAQETREMGKLTWSVGLVEVAEGQVYLQADCRFPQSTDEPTITSRLKEVLPAGWVLTTPFNTPAILYNQEAPGFQLLRDSFAQRYPDHSQLAEIEGGVTYAKVVPNCVAFGMTFEDDAQLAHQADEYIPVDNLSELLGYYTDLFWDLCHLEKLA